MLSSTDKERLATLEADIPWIKGALGRLELGMTEVHRSMESHLASRRHLVNSNGAPPSAATGINVQIGQKTAIAILGLFGSGGVAGVAGLLKVFGVLG